MPKRKTFNRRALSCPFTRTHLEGRRSVKLMGLRFKPVRASRVQGFQGPHGGSQLVLTLYRIYFFSFQMCNRSPELMKNGDAGIFPVYYYSNFTKFVNMCNAIHYNYHAINESLTSESLFSRISRSSVESLLSASPWWAPPR